MLHRPRRTPRDPRCGHSHHRQHGRHSPRQLASVLIYGGHPLNATSVRLMLEGRLALPNSAVDRLKSRSRRPCFSSHSPRSCTASRHLAQLQQCVRHGLREQNVSSVASAHWWSEGSWNRDEWDIALSTGALYRIYREPDGRWFVEGSYD